MENDTMLIMTPPDGEGGGDFSGVTPPDGFGGGGDFGGGGSSSSVSWDGATEIDSALTSDNPVFTSTSSGQNAVLIDTDETVTLNNPTVTKTGGDSAGDNESFYGTNSAVMVKGGSTTNINGGTITSDAEGANAVFSYGGNGGQNGAEGDGTTVNIHDANIKTTGNGSGGIMTTGGGVTNAYNLVVETNGQSSAAIRTDRGGGTVNVTGGSYTSNGLGSPAIYSTAAVTVNDATLNSTKSEGVCIEGLNSVTLNNCTLNANNTQTNGQASFFDSVMIYQSMSGDSAEGTSTFTMNGGTINSQSGHVFHVTNTSAIINLNGVTINNSDADNVLLSVCADGWSGASNVATVNASAQNLTGKILVGDDSTLTLNLINGAAFYGSVGGIITDASGIVVSTTVGDVSVSLDESSKWYLTEDTYLTSFEGNVANIINNGFSVYVNNNILDGTTSPSEETLPSGLTFNEDGTVITASTDFTGSVDLSNYPNVKTFDASKSSYGVSVLGNSQNNNLSSGQGNSILFGGTGHNYLTGGTSRDQFWFTGLGNDTVTNFAIGNADYSDVVTFYNTGLQSITRNGSLLTFTADNGNAMNVFTNTEDGNSLFLYSLDGSIGYGAKIGNDYETSLNFDLGANYYQLSGTDGTLYANFDTYKEIWLSNDGGEYFFGIKNVVANNAGENIIGGNDESNLIVGGSGGNTMWGGAENVSDTLQGGDGHNMFWYGLAEGNDLITNAKESDIVYLYDITLDNIAAAPIDAEKITITLNDGNSVTVQNSSTVTPTFQLAGGDRYNFNRSTGTWNEN
ncbi:MAG: hypothetical protein IJU91_08200 [Selenomonadaceae bacterium]|nr:hypothetical protein [Selenomonadaceae bacterium]